MLSFVYLVFIVFTRSAALFKVTVPTEHVVAVHGIPTVLGCVFTRSTEPDIESLVVTWQRTEDSRVVHSFYYGRDQLERQSSDYHNRTGLFASELANGNASLMIRMVSPEDVGKYLCTVSSAKGTDKAQLQLDYGAFYSEPRLSIAVNNTSVTLQYETEGFPEPEVRWLGEMGQNLSHRTELTPLMNRSGLFSLRSRFEGPAPQLNVTFILTNHLLKQVLKRPVYYDNGGDIAHNGSNGIIITLSLVCVALSLIILFVCYHRKKH
ncbi:CD276 antigen [Chanos chanos]|uniref:CD276 antigen n=1 Tax=Chanos chanos TaxID=29144 RepID=A0A6J2V8X0_CHACN|nr:CD276 antigen-like [Chanos chanos]